MSAKLDIGGVVIIGQDTTSLLIFPLLKHMKHRKLNNFYNAHSEQYVYF